MGTGLSVSTVSSSDPTVGSGVRGMPIVYCEICHLCLFLPLSYCFPVCAHFKNTHHEGQYEEMVRGQGACLVPFSDDTCGV